MPADQLSPPTPIDGRPMNGADGAAPRGPSNLRILIAVALVARVVGAGVGTAVTLIVGDPGPAGSRGPVGARGPAGPQGPPGDLSGIQDRVSSLASSVSGIDARLERLESSSGGDVQTQLDQLDQRLSDLESLNSGICTQLDLFC